MTVPASPDSAGLSRGGAALAGVVIAGITLLLYAPGLTAGFVGDDFMILHRLRALAGPADVLRFFGAEFFEYLPPDRLRRARGGLRRRRRRGAAVPPDEPAPPYDQHDPRPADRPAALARFARRPDRGAAVRAARLEPRGGDVDLGAVRPARDDVRAGGDLVDHARRRGARAAGVPVRAGGALQGVRRRAADRRGRLARSSVAMRARGRPCGVSSRGCWRWAICAAMRSIGGGISATGGASRLPKLLHVRRPGWRDRRCWPEARWKRLRDRLLDSRARQSRQSRLLARSSRPRRGGRMARRSRPRVSRPKSSRSRASRCSICSRRLPRSPRRPST